jgi:hypothetical protein
MDMYKSKKGIMCNIDMYQNRCSELSSGLYCNHFTRQYNPEENSEHHTRRRENLKSHMYQNDKEHGRTHSHNLNVTDIIRY